MEEVTIKLRELTKNASAEGNPETYKEQFQFWFSGERFRFYWQEDSFVLFFKPPMSGRHFEVAQCTISMENERAKIRFESATSKIGLLISRIFLFSIPVIVLSAWLSNNRPFIPIAFVPLMAWLAILLINRQHRKEVRWFLEDMVKKTTELKPEEPAEDFSPENWLNIPRTPPSS